jgi:hypothetical protein
MDPGASAGISFPVPERYPDHGVPSRVKISTAFKIATTVCVFSLPLTAQEPPPGEQPVPAEVPEMAFVEDTPPPPGLAQVELARSRRCVAGMARLDALNTRMTPLREREARLEALFQAVSLEDADRVAPFGESPLEVAVREWFEADGALAREYLASEDEAVQERRREAREAVIERLREAHEEVIREAEREAEEAMGGSDELGSIIRECEGAVLVRSAVLDACGTSESPICQAARAEEGTTSTVLFVNDPLDLWDMEQIRPWTEATALQATPDGGLTGARTSTLARRGNYSVLVTVRPMMQSRSSISEDEAREFDENLERLGIGFHHPAFVMAPALSFEVDVLEPLGGETHYILHFADLSGEGGGIIWAVPVSEGGPVGAFFTLEESTLVRLAQGHELVLTAARIPDEDEGGVADPIYSLEITAVGQSRAVAGLLEYMAAGGLSADLASFFPVEGTDGP